MDAGPIRVGRYVLHSKIASGGMAAVYFGRMVGEGGFTKTVAIKRLHRQFVRDPAFRQSILEEGRLAVRIRHPNVVPPLDVVSEGNELLLVMEYVHGESFSRLLRAGRTIEELPPVAISAAITSNVLSGLHAAHIAKDEHGAPLGVVHRDVSPQNVMVGIDGVARVIDFGIAKAVTTRENTSTGTLKGKVPYLAPEQLQGEKATRRTDTYAASVVFWEALAGHRLFDGKDDGDILLQIMEKEIEPPSVYNADVPSEIDEIVLRGLARDPAERFDTARDMAIAIEAAVHLATPNAIGAWTERLAAEALEERMKLLAEVEASGKPAPMSRRPPPLPVTPAAPPALPTSPSAPPPPVMAIPRPPTFAVKHDLETIAPLATADIQLAVPQPLDEPHFSATVKGQHVSLAKPLSPPTPFAPGSLPPPSMPSNAPRPPAAGVLRKPEVEIANVAWLPQATTKQKERVTLGKLGSYLGVIVVLGVILTWVALPILVRRWLVDEAAKQGVALSMDRVDVSLQSLRLVGVVAESSELPGVTVHAGAATVALRRSAPERITIDDLDIGIEGSYGDVASRYERFAVTRVAAIEGAFDHVAAVSVTSGRLYWEGVAGPKTTFALENATFDGVAAGGKPFGGNFKLTVAIVKLGGATSNAGPWALEAERAGTMTQTTLRLDPSGTYPASIRWSAADDGSSTTTFLVPPTPLADLRLPAWIVGGAITDKTQVSARGEIQLVSVGRAIDKTAIRTTTGRVVVAFHAIAPFRDGGPFDVVFDAPFAGDTATPIALDKGTMSLATYDPVNSKVIASAALVGKADPTPQALGFEIAAKTAPLPCTAGATTTLRGAASLTIARLSEGAVVFEPSVACVPRVKP